MVKNVTVRCFLLQRSSAIKPVDFTKVQKVDPLQNLNIKDLNIMMNSAKIPFCRFDCRNSY